MKTCWCSWLRAGFLVLVLMSAYPTLAHSATYYSAVNIMVQIQSKDLTTARDQALLEAQKRALAGFTAATDAAKVKQVDNLLLSRSMKDFSLQNERMDDQAYQAGFNIRFDATKFEGLLRTYGIALPTAKDIDLANAPPPSTGDEAQAGEQADGDKKVADAAPAGTPVIVLPILDIGARRVLWDEPNPWRDAWQKQSKFNSKTAFVVPLGDVDDMGDIPDGHFIDDKKLPENVRIGHMLERYKADKMYVLLAKSQGASLNPGQGLEIKVFSYDAKGGNPLAVIQSSARPGYLFDDAVPFTVGKLDDMAQGKQAAPPPVAPTPALAAVTAPLSPAAPLTGVPDRPSSQAHVMAQIPIANLGQWVRIQQNLRRTNGISQIITQQISPQSVTVRIESGLPLQTLLRNIQGSGFGVSQNPDGSYMLRPLTL